MHSPQYTRRPIHREALRGKKEGASVRVVTILAAPHVADPRRRHRDSSLQRLLYDPGCSVAAPAVLNAPTQPEKTRYLGTNDDRFTTDRTRSKTKNIRYLRRRSRHRLQLLGSSFGHEQEANVDRGWKVLPPITEGAPLAWDGRTFHLLQYVNMVTYAREAATGDGVCIGLTYRDRAFINPKQVTTRH
jgi:hypothetical protein